MKTSKFPLIIFIVLITVQVTDGKIVVAVPGDDMNFIVNGAPGGDTVLIKAGTYGSVSLTEKRCTEKAPLVIRQMDSEKVIISGSTVSGGCALEIRNCSYVVVEGIAFTNALWGIYVRNSDHIIIRDNEIYGTSQEGSHIGRSSKHIDVFRNKIHNTGLFNSKWAEGVYVGSGSYSAGNFPDNCEYVWIEDNLIYETGNAEGINIKGESFHVTVRNNKIHDIHPGTSEQYNQAGITVEGAANSIDHGYRLSEKRDVWVENNTVWTVSGGYSDWNNGIMFFGTGVYILNNTIYDCTNRGIYGNNWKDLGLQNYVYRNKISRCSIDMYLHPDLNVSESYPGENPNSPQKWHP
jgi:nitrous oxidase accessory protein NosD